MNSIETPEPPPVLRRYAADVVLMSPVDPISERIESAKLLANLLRFVHIELVETAGLVDPAP